MAEVRSTIVCPACGHRESEIMPEDVCQYFYKCKGCRVVLKPKKGITASSAPTFPTAQRNTRGRREIGARTGSWFVV